MSKDALDSTRAISAIVAARVPLPFAELHPYVPDPTPVAIRLDANEAPALLPTLTRDERAAFDAALTSVEPARYPDVRARALRSVLAARSGVDHAQLVIGCGSDEVIAILLASLARP